MINVLIIDDHALFRQGLVMLLSDLYNNVEISEAGGIDHAIDICRSNGEFDLILLDLAMSGMDGFDGLRLLGKDLPNVPIVIVTASENRADIHSAFLGGAKGYIVKSATTRVLEHALRLVLSGESYVPPLVIEAEGKFPGDNSFANDGPPKTLTPRQQQVLILMAEGRSNKEIARNLGMLEGTVKVHAKAIFQKLGVNNRTKAVLAGIRIGYVPQHALAGASPGSRPSAPRSNSDPGAGRRAKPSRP